MSNPDAAQQDRNGHVPPNPDNLIPSQRARRQRIVVAALELLNQSTYDKIQMRDVAEAAGVALGTVYRYFASKEHLFAAVLVEWSELMSQRVQRRPLRGVDAVERLDDMMGRVLTSFERRPQFFVLVTVVEATPDVYAKELYARFGERSNETFQEALEHVDPADGEDVILIADAVLVALLRAWIRGEMSMADARRRMSRSIELIFSSPTSQHIPSSGAPVTAHSRRRISMPKPSGVND